MDCLFCKIIAGEIPSAKVYENDAVFAFRDIQPQAPVHVLIVPKKHIASVDEVTPENSEIVRRVMEAIPEVAKAASPSATCISTCSEVPNSPNAWRNRRVADT